MYSYFSALISVFLAHESSSHFTCALLVAFRVKRECLGLWIVAFPRDCDKDLERFGDSLNRSYVIQVNDCRKSAPQSQVFLSILFSFSKQNLKLGP